MVRGSSIPAYDADGNMTSDGRFAYTWNDENRMVSASNAEVVATYAYDHRGRMIRKTVSHSGADPILITYLWDGWNIIREELRTLHSQLHVTHNLWGLDLDGTMQGAGGVGGLLAVIRDGETYIPTYDANGNISEYIDSSDGTIAAHYDYSPFGETLISSGPLASSFTHRFSTKPHCLATSFCEYQTRKYRPDIGRWMSRDPIEEQAKNENSGYCFCCNSSIRFFDKCGLISRQEVEDVLFFHPVQSSILKDEFLPEDLKALGLAKARIEYRCRCSSNVLLCEIHFFPLIVYRHGEFSDNSRQITVFQHEYNHTVVYKNIWGPTLATMFLSEYAGQKCCNCENRLENAIAKFKELEKGISIWDINTEYYTRGRGHMQPNIDYGQSRGVLKKTVQKVLSSGVVPCEN